MSVVSGRAALANAIGVARRRWRSLGLLGLLLATGAVYLPGLSGPFLLDDIPNISANRALRIETLDGPALWKSAFYHDAKYPARGLARMSFALNYHFSGGRIDARAFKATNLGVHLLNGVLVYLLVALLARRRAEAFTGARHASSSAAGPQRLALLVAGLWMLHPLQLTAVLYAVQRMTSLAALFVLGGLWLFAWGRTRVARKLADGWWWMLAGVGAGTTLGFLCKENAALLPLYALLVEIFFFRRNALDPRRARMLRIFYGVTVGVPALVLLGYLASHPEFILSDYRFRSFTLWERALSEPRILFFYLSLWFYPTPRRFGLFHDDLATSTGWLDPWTTCLAAAGWLALGLAALTWGKRQRSPWAFAALWFLIGHAIESTVLPLELIFEHRNYVPSLGLAVAGGYYLLRLSRHGEGLRRAAPMISLLLLGVLGFATFVRAGVWSDSVTLDTFMARNHPASPRGRKAHAVALEAGGAPASFVYAAFRDAAAARADEISALIAMAPLTLRALAQARATGGEQATGAPAHVPRLFEAELGNSVSHIEALWRQLNAEIERRLRVQALSAPTVNSLVRLAECIVNGNPDCARLRAAVFRWHRLAIGSRRLLREHVAVLEMSLAQLEVAAGNLRAGIVHMRQATLAAPGDPQYPIAEAQLYARERRWDNLEGLLERLERSAALGRSKAEVLTTVRRLYANARTHTGGLGDGKR